MSHLYSFEINFLLVASFEDVFSIHFAHESEAVWQHVVSLLRSTLPGARTGAHSISWCWLWAGTLNEYTFFLCCGVAFS